jgi:hypothetical protein
MTCHALRAPTPHTSFLSQATPLGLSLDGASAGKQPTPADRRGAVRQRVRSVDDAGGITHCRAASLAESSQASSKVVSLNEIASEAGSSTSSGR